MEKKSQLDSRQNHNKFLSREMLDYLKDGWCWLALGVVAGVVLFVMTLPVQYEAKGIVQVGKALGYEKDFVAEQTAIALERVKLGTFYNNELVQACKTSSGSSLSSAIKASPIRGGVLIQLSFRAKTAAIAEACVDAVVGHLAESQRVEVSKSRQELLLPLRLLEPVFVYEKWVYPEMLLSLVGLLLGGLVFGGLLFLVRLRWLKRRTNVHF